MFLRALIAFLALPGVIAIAVPAAFAAAGRRAEASLFLGGLLALIAGFLLLLWCVRDFHVSGQGTLAPWSPPKHLVTIGLYRYSRNPMYLAVALMLIGWSLSFASTRLATYTVFVMLAFHLRVVLGEEPWLARTHGAVWDQYKSKVPRWLL
ncbi:MAG TPA: isoprenylcysteine carboxylmethyltransferase family protein [Steroidobacteraceae bacterium]|nr:isoprenylcysteine carboxylmethyltransferase family protein [Steroidobacteraceae bacterium]